MTTATEDEEVLSFRIAELNSGRSFVVGYGGVWKLLSAVDKLQQYGAAAEATVGQVLTYNGKLKLVPYHEISSGKTRDGKEVFHSADYGYLKSVESSQDREAPDYVNSTYVPASQLPAKLVVKKRDSAGYVTALTADGNWLEGETFSPGHASGFRRFFSAESRKNGALFMQRKRTWNWIFPVWGEMRWRRKGVAGRRYWRHIFRRWRLRQ